MTDKSNANARDLALSYCADFISEWDRAASIMEGLENELSQSVGDAIGRGKALEPAAVNSFMLNIYWLRRMLQQSCEDARKHLEAAGQDTDPRS